MLLPDENVTFWQLVRDSIIVQSLVTLMLVGCIVTMCIMQIQIPDYLQVITSIVVGFWFGSKVQNAIHQANQSWRGV